MKTVFKQDFVMIKNFYSEKQIIARVYRNGEARTSLDGNTK